MCIECSMEDLLLSGVLPLSLVILSNLSAAVPVILASRFCRRMRACRCAGVSSASAMSNLVLPRTSEVEASRGSIDGNKCSILLRSRMIERRLGSRRTLQRAKAEGS